MSSEFFEAEHFVIVKSTHEIDCLDWIQYFIDNWNKIIKQGTKLLVLAGVHGGQDGAIGSRDKNLLKDIQLQIKRLERIKYTDMQENNIRIVLVDVGECLDSSASIDNSKLVEIVKKHNPTVISLAFCLTNISILNDILRSSGIYSLLIMAREREIITNNETSIIKLDLTQRQIIEKMACEQFKNVFLWGSSGTGKTIMLLELMSMKVSHHKVQSHQMNIFVTSYLAMPQSQLIQDFKEKYLVHLKSSYKFQCIPFCSLCEDLDLYFDMQHPLAMINSVINQISKKYKNSYNILLVDEVLPVNEFSSKNEFSDWSNLNTTQYNIELLIALNPQGINFMNDFKVIPPPSDFRTLSQQLFGRHRNSFEGFHLLEHFKRLPNTSYLDSSNDTVLDKENLPIGRLPVWLEIFGNSSDEQILEFIKSSYIYKHESVTLIFNKYELKDKRKNKVTKWCIKNGWNSKHYSYYFGCEDNVIVLFQCSMVFELISRARNQVIFVTNTR